MGPWLGPFGILENFGTLEPWNLGIDVATDGAGDEGLGMSSMLQSVAGSRV